MSDASILFVDHTAMMGGAQHSLLDIAEANRRRSAVALFEDGPFATALEARGVAVLPLSGGSALRQVKKNSIVPGVGPLIATMRLARTLARTAHQLARATTVRTLARLKCPWPRMSRRCQTTGLRARRPASAATTNDLGEFA